MTRGRLVIGNWKMNPATADAVALARTVGALPHPGADVAVAPPVIALAAVAEALRGTDVAVYAQDVHWGGLGCVHRSDQRGDAPRPRDRRDRWPLRGAA